MSAEADLLEFRREIESKCQKFEVFPKSIHPTELIALTSGAMLREPRPSIDAEASVKLGDQGRVRKET